MIRVTELTLIAFAAASSAVFAETIDGQAAPNPDAPAWINVALVGNTAAIVAPRYTSTADAEDPDESDTADADLSDADQELDEAVVDDADFEELEGETVNFIIPSGKATTATAQSTAPASNIWPRIRSRFAFPEINNRRVRQFETWYRKHPEHFANMMGRSALFLHYIVEEVEKRGMPAELVLLPMIESAYNPTAYSRAHASGIWQFIPSTGKNFGLEQNWWHDERRDVVAATAAALDYLEKLHSEFNDWQLALAAYNWGENGVRRAIKRNQKRGRPADYHSLRMPRETRNYLPKLQAVKNIISEPERLGLSLPYIPDQPYFTRVRTRDHIDVALAARLAEMSIEDFEVLNAAYNRPVIASDGEREILLPLDKANTFATNLQGHDEPLVSWQTYEIQKGETVENIAARFDMSVDKLRQINGIKPYVELRAGHSLLVPITDDAVESNLDETWNRPEFNRPNNFYGTRIVHKIKRGDTLSTIAQRYGVSVRGIKSWNRINGTTIRAGSRLVIYRDLRVPRVSKMLQ